MSHKVLFKLFHAFIKLVQIIVNGMYVLAVFVYLFVYILHLLVEHLDLAQLLLFLWVDNIELTKELVQLYLDGVFTNLSCLHECSSRVLLSHQVFELFLNFLELLIKLSVVQMILRIIWLCQNLFRHRWYNRVNCDKKIVPTSSPFCELVLSEARSELTFALERLILIWHFLAFFLKSQSLLLLLTQLLPYLLLGGLLLRFLGLRIVLVGILFVAIALFGSGGVFLAIFCFFFAIYNRSKWFVSASARTSSSCGFLCLFCVLASIFGLLGCGASVSLCLRSFDSFSLFVEDLSILSALHSVDFLLLHWVFLSAWLTSTTILTLTWLLFRWVVALLYGLVICYLSLRLTVLLWLFEPIRWARSLISDCASHTFENLLRLVRRFQHLKGFAFLSSMNNIWFNLTLIWWLLGKDLT